jgi:hypothetical protein
MGAGFCARSALLSPVCASPGGASRSFCICCAEFVCEFWPVVTPVESAELVFGLAPGVGPLPASLVDVAPFVGPLPASAFGCAYAARGTLRTIPDTSKVLANENMKASLRMVAQFNSTDRRTVPGRGLYFGCLRTGRLSVVLFCLHPMPVTVGEMKRVGVRPASRLEPP